jgi:hypothetical protein
MAALFEVVPNEPHKDRPKAGSCERKHGF